MCQVVWAMRQANALHAFNPHSIIGKYYYYSLISLRKQSFGAVKWPTQCYVASNYINQDVDPDITAESMLFITALHCLPLANKRNCICPRYQVRFPKLTIHHGEKDFNWKK